MKLRAEHQSARISKNFDIQALLTISPELHSAQMSKITNYSLTPSGTGCFIAVPIGNSGRQRVKCTLHWSFR